MPVFGHPKSPPKNKKTGLGPGAYDVKSGFAPTNISIGRSEVRQAVDFNPAPGMYNVEKADKVVKYRPPEALISPAKSARARPEQQSSPGPGEHTIRDELVYRKVRNAIINPLSQNKARRRKKADYLTGPAPGQYEQGIDSTRPNTRSAVFHPLS